MLELDMFRRRIRAEIDARYALAQTQLIEAGEADRGEILLAAARAVRRDLAARGIRYTGMCSNGT